MQGSQNITGEHKILLQKWHAKTLNAKNKNALVPEERNYEATDAQEPL